MAEDGMVLNFEEPDTSVVAQPKLRGGSWKDRLAAKNRTAHKATKSKSTVGGEKIQSSIPKDSHSNYEASEGLSELPPKKRPRQFGQFTPATPHLPQKSKPTPQRHVEGFRPPQGKEIISSLFTSNPTPALHTHSQQRGRASQNAQPSNAPLLDGIDTFTTLGLTPQIAAHLLTKMGIKNPTGIQQACIPQLLKENCDAFIQSETGSGKTLAYLLPLVQKLVTLSEQSKSPQQHPDKLSGLHRSSGLFVIVLAPTRELCKQISVVLECLLGCARWIVQGTVIGGEKKKSEKARLRKGINILVATPGRLVDHLENTRVLDVGSVRWLVLDEGDRLMELGFEEEIQKIVQKLDSLMQENPSANGLPPKRMTILCSATMKMNVQRLGEISLKDAIHVRQDSRDSKDIPQIQANDEINLPKFSAPAQLQQSYAVVPAKLRLATLTGFLKRTFMRKGSTAKAIVFLSCADSVDFHFDLFSQDLSLASPDTDGNANSSNSFGRISPSLSTSTNKLSVFKLHGSLPQHTRTSIVREYATTKTAALLLATDVASRGLDLPNLELVIEYDPSFSADDHLHRIGRTARLGREGRAMMFLLPGPEEGYVELLRQSYQSRVEASASLTHILVDEILKRGFVNTTTSSLGQSVITTKSKFAAAATDFQLKVERLVQTSVYFSALAKRAFQSHIRAYATHVASERQYFNVKDLHLGHLAKCFGLRDKPSHVNVQGMRNAKSDKRVHTDGRKGARETSGTHVIERRLPEGGFSVDTGDAKARMRRKMLEQMAGAAEFNVA
ncbi:MAG: hypothetical protein Q9227_005882 [Pyrenula ochraceoflavens]